MTTFSEYFEAPRERRLPTYLHWITSWEEWLSFALLSAAVLAAVTSIARADWVDGMTNLLLISFVALVAGFLLAHVRASATLLQAPVLGLGILLLTWQILAVVPGAGFSERWDLYWQRIGDWLGVANDGGISNDPLPFITIVSIATFVTSYIAAWSVFRWRNAWIALLPVGVILFINISFLPGEFDFALIIFLFCAFLLTVRMAMTRRQEQWQREDVEYPELISLTSLHDGAWVAGVLLIAAWVIPTANNIPVLDNAWDGSVGGVGSSGTIERLFAGVDSKQEREIREYDNFFSFKGNLDLSDRTLLRVRVVDPTLTTLLRGATYEEYSPIGWLTSERRQEPVRLDVAVESEAETINEQLPALSGIEDPNVQVAGVSTRAETDTLFSIGQPLGADVEAGLISTNQTTFLFDIEDAGADRNLPSDIRAVSETIRDAANLNPLPLTNDEIAARIPDGLVVTSLQRDVQGEVSQLLVARGGGVAYDTTALEAPEALPGDSEYVSVGVVNTPSVDDLNAAGDNYPQWVTDTYLQLSDDLPQRVRDLAARVAGVQTTAFGRAVEIQNYLRNAYPVTNYGVDSPPVGADGVDYFLFEVGPEQGAFSDYHASAMAVMLRSLDIPARLATGYYLDPEDLEENRFRVRESDLFTWTDVYFPGIGWVEFNPSPAGPILYLTSEDLPGSSGSFFPQSLNENDLPEFDTLAPGLAGLGDVTLEGGITTEDEDGTGALDEGSSSFPTEILIAVLAVFGGLVFLLIAGNAVWQWGVRGLNYPAQVWEKTIRLANWSGIGVRPSDTPREFARKLSSGLPEVKGIEEMETAYSRAQFGRKELTADEQARVKKVWSDVRGALTARLLRLRRPKQP